jgi:hypothetical protein
MFRHFPPADTLVVSTRAQGAQRLRLTAPAAIGDLSRLDPGPQPSDEMKHTSLLEPSI